MSDYWICPSIGCKKHEISIPLSIDECPNCGISKPEYRCPKCMNCTIIGGGNLTVHLNKGTIFSVEDIKYFKCLDCGLEEEWIPEDGIPIFSELEKEWYIGGRS